MTRKQGPIRSANNDRLELDPALARVGLESLRDSCSSLISLLNMEMPYLPHPACYGFVEQWKSG